ncbi:nucleotidyltransferase domain-containing protein [Methylobacterium flocculans]|uniref:nucleotidyltransferase domain-containing protein n=1 Tax=Methylobacterium flocculans TaxID=2984843 RepID=UPI0021F26E77|nr:nucleotidyltransferase domain-containing protein [Methylobacterium sp. FF17]
MSTPYERSKLFSDEKLTALREGLGNLVPAGEAVVTCGSYARREASENSDLDYFIITQCSEGASDHSWGDKVRDVISSLVKTEPAAGGAFSGIIHRASMTKDIGGDGDDNAHFTRRMLFLLEGAYLANEAEIRSFRREILERYIGEKITNPQIALFLLNDVIRYYRTMAVDYEFKTVEGTKPKPWGLRNIKLVFSRKLLYASGLFSVAMTVDRTRDKKIETLEKLFDMPVIDRMQYICGKSAMENVLERYNVFLERLEDHDVRSKLTALTRDERSDKLFREIKNEGHLFTRDLLKLFDNSFDSTHPIRKAVLF